MTTSNKAGDAGANPQDNGTTVQSTEESSELEALYRQMLTIRGFDERAMELRASGLIGGSVHPYIGQEAVAVGVCAALRAGDRVASTHRGHGHCLAMGVDVRQMMAELLGRRDGVCGGKGGSMHICDYELGMLGANGIVAAGVPIACGAALSEQLDRGNGVAVTFFGDGASGQGVLYESINLAVLWKLPVIFVCENNGYASDTPLAMTIAGNRFADVAAGFGIATQEADGDDVLAVRAAAVSAVEAARGAAGPQLIECITYRWGPHVQRFPDLRDPTEVAAARDRDAIRRLRRDMIEHGYISDAGAEEISDEVAGVLDRAVEWAKASPEPAPLDALVDVFA